MFMHVSWKSAVHSILLTTEQRRRRSRWQSAEGGQGSGKKPKANSQHTSVKRAHTTMYLLCPVQDKND
uniref:Secreted protein n=1 Tax=Heterorhabditis bacteriophora TaxID=37862 RepID=A0A1I7XSR3_HETBA